MSGGVIRLLQSLCAILFGLTSSPGLAALYYNMVVGLYVIHHFYDMSFRSCAPSSDTTNLTKKAKLPC